ncbi:MAG: helix-turn-helix transcriptional regulator [Rhodospirillaceae bacterium]|nr:helix-turn-helix transcriptional regulator [Rhodospirillaceae bacterium]
MARLTPFGRLVRKHRIDAGLLLKDMAEQLRRSAAFLSAVEMGEKPIPAGLAKQIAEYLKLDHEKTGELEEAAERSQREYRITVGRGASDSQREVAAMFARRFSSLTPEDLEQFKDVLTKRQG